MSATCQDCGLPLPYQTAGDPGVHCWATRDETGRIDCLRRQFAAAREEGHANVAKHKRLIGQIADMLGVGDYGQAPDDHAALAMFAARVSAIKAQKDDLSDCIREGCREAGLAPTRHLSPEVGVRRLVDEVARNRRWALDLEQAHLTAVAELLDMTRARDAARRDHAGLVAQIGDNDLDEAHIKLSAAGIADGEISEKVGDLIERTEVAVAVADALSDYLARDIDKRDGEWDRKVLPALRTYRVHHGDSDSSVARADPPRVVVLCGSTRFRDAWVDSYAHESDAGRIVLTVSRLVPEHAVEAMDPARKVRIDELHRRKIDLADEVLVLNVDGYIGESTRGEIEYATAHGKPIRYLEPAPSAQPATGHASKRGTDDERK